MMPLDGQEREELTVRTQRHRQRWGYVVEEPGWHTFVSRYIYSSQEAAQRAGELDTSALAGVLDTERPDEMPQTAREMMDRIK
jgi:hypothetical protein